MDEKNQAQFVLAILERTLPSGQTKYQMGFTNDRVPDEHVMVIVKNFLRTLEDKYYEKFKKDYSA